MQFNTYTSAGAHIAAALVNDPMTDSAAVGALLAGFDVEEPVPGEAELADLRDWTARLRSVFEPLAEADRAELVNDLLVESDCRPRLITHDGLPHHLHYRPLAGDLAARVKAFTAAGLAYLIAEGWGSRLGRCQREGCAVAFVDTSRNGTRRFCSVRCANQVNVSNHRVRRRAAPRRLPRLVASLTGPAVCVRHRAVIMSPRCFGRVGDAVADAGPGFDEGGVAEFAA